MNPYCVILRPKSLVHSTSLQPIQYFYIGAPTAHGAIETASDENPGCRVVGIEPNNLSPRGQQKQPSRSVRMTGKLVGRTAR
jgi:hypothetical protein